jgi:uncharacterized protein
MKLPDTNVLLYSVNPLSPHHKEAVLWLESAFDDPAGVGLAWLALIGFIRLSTSAAILPKPLSIADACGMVDEWMAHSRARLLHPTERHAGIMTRLLLLAGTAGNLTNDAHLAALSVEHCATVGSFDKDFKKFANIKLDLLG